MNDKTVQWARDYFGDRRDATGKLVADNFMRWFGQSASVDHCGRPFRLYHGSPRDDLDCLDLGYTCYGLYLTPDPDTAQYYTGANDCGRVYEVLVRYKNLADLDEPQIFIAIAKEALDYREVRDDGDACRFLVRLYCEGFGKNQAVTDFFRGFEGINDVGDGYTIEDLIWEESVDASDVEDLVGRINLEHVTKAFNEAAPIHIPEIEEAIEAYGTQNFYMHYQNDFMRAAQNLGYDAVVFSDPSTTGASISYVIFNPGNVQFVTNDFSDPDLVEDLNLAKSSAPVIEFAKCTYTDAVDYAGVKGWEYFVKNFGNSQVVDDAGAPILVYRGEHGVAESPLQTRLPTLSFGTLATAREYARNPHCKSDLKSVRDPRIIPAYLRIEKPFLNDKADPFLDFEKLESALGFERAKALFIKHSDAIEHAGKWIDEHSREFDSVSELPDHRFYELYAEAFRFLDDPEVVSELKLAGYDGAIHGGTGVSALEPEYKVFSANQIISAVDGKPLVAFEQVKPVSPQELQSHQSQSMRPTVTLGLEMQYG